MDASTKIAPKPARPAAATAPTTTPARADAPTPSKGAKPPKAATTVAALTRPAHEPASRRDVHDGAGAIGRPGYTPFVPDGSPLDILLEQRGRNVIGGRPAGANGATRANVTSDGDAPPADRAPDELRKVLQGIGGAARGVATAGSGIAQTIARGAPFKIGRVPGAAILTGGLALYDTVQEFRRSGFSDATARTAAGGIGGVAGAFKGGAIGASIGAFGGPIGAVVGGAAGAIIGGIAGSSVGQGVADGFAAAREVIRNADIDNVGDVFEVAGEAAREGAKAFGSTAWSGISSQVSDIAGGIAHGVGWIADTVGDAAEEVADTVSDAVDTVTDVAGDVADVAGDVLDSITPW
ncbi:MAG: hypothetical protein JWL76_13 [Thermoleophilia bacterium]|nr:hypothetical protein [Thermoleophilia bacterium]